MTVVENSSKLIIDFTWIKESFYSNKITKTLLWAVLISYFIFFHACLKYIGRSNEAIITSAIISLSGISLYLLYVKITRKKYIDLADDINKSLASMNDKDTGEFLAFIIDFSNEIEKNNNINLYDPQSVKEKYPDFSEKILIRLNDENANSPIGWSMVVWWLTLHAVTAEEYRYDVRSIWKKLASGASALESMNPAARAALIGRRPESLDHAFEQCGRIPKGFE